MKKGYRILLLLVVLLGLSACDTGNSGDKGEIPSGDIPTNIVSMEQYTIQYMIMDTIYETYTYLEGQPIVKPENPTISGYTFLGWEEEIPSAMPKENLTVHAKLDIHSHKLSYVLDGDIYLEPEDQFYDSVITFPTVTLDSDTVFSGWINRKEKMPDEDLVIYGYTYSLTNTEIIDLSQLTDGQIYTITQGGTYIVTGTADNAQLVINGKNQDFTLLWNNASLTYLGDGPAVSCTKGNQVTITLLEGTTNQISDSSANTSDAALQVKSANLTINGTGKLTINSQTSGIYNTKNMIVEGGDITIQSEAHGICVKNSLSILGGNIVISSKKDGLKAKGDFDTANAYILNSGKLSIQGGNISITSEGDGIDIVGDFLFENGNITIEAMENGLKAVQTITIKSGKIEITSKEDGIKTTTDALIQDVLSSIVILGGNIKIDAKEDGIQSETSFVIYPMAKLTITSSDGVNGSVQTDLNGEVVSAKGIKVKTTCQILGGWIECNSLDTAIRVEDRLEISGGILTLQSGKSGIKVANDTNTMGSVQVSNGSIDINAKDNGIEAALDMIITAGTIKIITTGTERKTKASGTGYETNDEGYYIIESHGLCASGNIKVSGGVLDITSTGHSVKASKDIIISNEYTSLTLYAFCSSYRSNSKGMTADGNLQIEGGKVRVSYSYEGLEAKETVHISSGNIVVFSTDDGINGGKSIEVSGGYTYIYAKGDGIDSNDTITISDGILIVLGPSMGGNSCLDSENGLTYTGGIVLGVAASQSMWDHDVINRISGSYIYKTNIGSVSSTVALVDENNHVIIGVLMPFSGSIGLVYMNNSCNLANVKCVLNGTMSGSLNENNVTFSGDVSNGSSFTLTYVENGIISAVGPGPGGIPGDGNRPPRP